MAAKAKKKKTVLVFSTLLTTLAKSFAVLTLKLTNTLLASQIGNNVRLDDIVLQ